MFVPSKETECSVVRLCVAASGMLRPKQQTVLTQQRGSVLYITYLRAACRAATVASTTAGSVIPGARPADMMLAAAGARMATTSSPPAAAFGTEVRAQAKMWRK